MRHKNHPKGSKGSNARGFGEPSSPVRRRQDRLVRRERENEGETDHCCEADRGIAVSCESADGGTALELTEEASQHGCGSPVDRRVAEAFSKLVR